MTTEKSAVSYLAKHAGIKELHYFQNKRNQGAWFTIIYGEYTTKESASKASKKLPASLGKLQPWLRSFEAVKADIYIK